MAKRLKLLTVCGFGVGTSLILKMTIDKVLKNNGIDAEVTNGDVTTASGAGADVIFFTSNELYSQLKGNVSAPVIQIDNFMSSDEITEKALPVINKLI